MTNAKDAQLRVEPHWWARRIEDDFCRCGHQRAEHSGAGPCDVGQGACACSCRVFRRDPADLRHVEEVRV